MPEMLMIEMPSIREMMLRTTKISIRVKAERWGTEN
jgi:hypothetical protein